MRAVWQIKFDVTKNSLLVVLFFLIVPVSDGSVAEGESVRKLTILVEMASEYDPKNGDWWYASGDETGTRVGQQGRLDDCIPCHKQAAETD